MRAILPAWPTPAVEDEVAVRMLWCMRIEPEFCDLPQYVARDASDPTFEPLVQHVPDEQNLVHDLLEMAACPERFSQSELGLMLLVAATAIIKLHQFGIEGAAQIVERGNHPANQHGAPGRAIGLSRRVASDA